jgi:hypothetical protein
MRRSWDRVRRFNFVPDEMGEVSRLPIEVAVICPGQFAAATERCSSVEIVVHEMSRRLPEPYRATIYSRRTDGTPLSNKSSQLCIIASGQPAARSIFAW